MLLELGYDGRGTLAENHHVCPIHPEYADIGAPVRDAEAARQLMEEAGMLDFEHELISIDDDWRRNTTDALAAQMRDAGLKVKRTVLPGNTFWNDWDKYPFSSTDWGHRPLGVQVLTLAYKTGVAWNETGLASAEFDSMLEAASAIADADTAAATWRRSSSHARRRHRDPALLALALPPCPVPASSAPKATRSTKSTCTSWHWKPDHLLSFSNKQGAHHS